MGESPNIWFAFGQTFAMLALVLAVMIIGFYLVKKFSLAKSGAGSRDMIKILTVHHLSPKEKLVLVNVLGDNILIGVTATNISKIAAIDKEIDLSESDEKVSPGFSHFLSRNMAGAIQKKFKGDMVAKEKDEI